MLGYYDPFGGLFGDMMGIYIAVLVVALIINIAIMVWVYKDAKARDMNATLWLVIVLLTGCIGCIIYLIIREPKK